MTIQEIEARKAEIAVEIENEGADLDALEEEVRSLAEQEKEIRTKAEEEKELRARIAEGVKPVVIVEEKEIEEEREKIMTNLEVRGTQEYIDAFVKYIKSNDDTECRALLTENVNGVVPVPTYVEGRIKTAWNRLGIMDLVTKTYVKGNLKIGFELSADAAVIHTEGTNAPAEETLTFGVVSLIPASIKKWIKISDEAMDMGGTDFLDYVYDELTYQIAKKAQSELISKIVSLTGTASTSAVSVGIVKGTPSVGVIATAIGQLSDEADNPVIVMNKGTWAQFKAAQYANGYAVDPFEGLPVFFDNTLTVYSTASTTGTWAIVGDFGKGAHANFPNGAEITIKYDDLSLAESDLVKLVGRQYVGLGIVADKAFTKITF